MKLAITSFSLIAAALLSTSGYAATETISGARGAYCDLSTATKTLVIAEPEADPMQKAVNDAVKSTSDPVLASYYRDLYMAPIPKETMTFVRIPDPYVDALSRALRGSVEPDSMKTC